MNNAEIKFIKQECKRMIHENFTQAFDWMAHVIATEDFQNTVKEHSSKQAGLFELHITTEAAGLPVTGVTFAILETIGLLFGTGVEINGEVRRLDYDNFFDSMNELSEELSGDTLRESIISRILKQIDEADDEAFGIKS